MSLHTAPMKKKREWLLTECLSTLNAFGYSNFTGSVYVDPFLLKAGEGGSIEEANRIMGNPIAYVRVQHEGSDDLEVLTLEGKQAKTAHRFGVYVWFERNEAEEGYASSIKWDNLIENHEEEELPIGLLPALRRTGNFQTSEGIVVEVGSVLDVDVLDVEISRGDDLLAHHLQFRISLT